MTDQSKIRHHAALMDRVAARLGIDLEAAVFDGKMAFGEVSEAVLRCADCPNPEDCAHWLDREEERAEAAPVYCQNRALFERLSGEGA